MPRGIRLAPLSSWLEANVPAVVPPVTVELIAAGGSNLTYALTDSSGLRLALRRPPEGVRPASAHDVGREVWVLRALAGSAVPAVVVTCEDFAKREGYVERQLARWRKQAERSKTRDLPLVDEVHDHLAKCIPRARGRVSLVHGDYRFDNCVLDPEARIRAVLDWELCTLGDPVADFCWSLLYWADPGDPCSVLSSPPTLHAGFPRRDEVAELYARRSGRDLSDLPFYTAFGWWKMACLVEGVYARPKAGAGGGMASEDLPAVAARTDQLLEIAAQSARGL